MVPAHGSKGQSILPIIEFVKLVAAYTSYSKVCGIVCEDGAYRFLILLHSNAYRAQASMSTWSCP